MTARLDNDLVDILEARAGAMGRTDFATAPATLERLRHEWTPAPSMQRRTVLPRGVGVAVSMGAA